MAANESVMVPSGAIVTSPNGSTITINGSSNTVSTQVGATVNVPASATGPATNLVTTGQTSNANVSTAPLTVTALAGSATVTAGSTSAPTIEDGTEAAAILRGGGHLAVDNDGNVIFSDEGALRKATPHGVVTTLSAAARPYEWDGIAIDAANNIYGSGASVALASISPATFGASINEMTASGAPLSLYPNWETSTSNIGVGFGGLVVDSKGNLFLADQINNRIVKFSPPNGWTVFAGNGTAGNADGIGTAATLTLNTSDLGIDANDNLYVASPGIFRKIAANGTVMTITPLTRVPGSTLAVDPAGNIYTADMQMIYRTAVNGTVTAYPFSGSTDRIASLAFDKNNNLYLGTQGLGAQIFKVSF
jgi:sugar lactone lactonase YvrE